MRARFPGASSTASCGPIETTPPEAAAATCGGSAAAGAEPGWVATRLAIERTCPVFTSITTAVPLTAFDDSMARANVCSDWYWSWGSIVSSSPVPGVVATWLVIGAWGSVTPDGDSMIVSLPFVPSSIRLYPYSRPAAP